MALPIFQRTVVDNSGNIQPNAQISVFNEATGLPVDVFADRNGTSPLGSVFFVGADALVRFYAPPGEYRIQADGQSGQISWRFVQLIDTQDITTIASNFAAVETASDNIQAIIDAPQAASDAEAARDAAELSLAEFQGTYYGPLAADPTEDPNGNPPTEGDLYFNTVANALRVFDGTSWAVFGGTAAETSYDNTASGLDATNVQELGDELAQLVVLRITGNTTTRQTVLTGPVDSNGRANFIAAGTGLQAVTTGLTSNPLQITFGDGFDLGEQRNLGVKIDSDLTWSGLPDNEDEIFLFVRVTESGVVSTFHSLLASEYAQSAPSSPADGQTFYPIDHRHRMQERVGGSWVSDDLIICVGECVTNGGSVVSVVSYAFQGVFEGIIASSPANTAYIVSHNLGMTGKMVSANCSAVAKSSGGGYLVGEVIDFNAWVSSRDGTGDAWAFSYPSRKVVSMQTNNASLRVPNKTGSGVITMASLSPDIFAILKRSF